ncbi:serine hydrolase [Gemmata sp. G18]|uniref:D-alanyl-D-alanine dipeptidase n=1 Tax=Gemmata palustris TaxID=2822762 RepID=A0ABS5BXX8_9BACT|nr:serine hydrolase [Gemmata palustris]MBP3958100.1 serine hydrolase [Gemmata palustris]
MLRCFVTVFALCALGPPVFAQPSVPAAEPYRAAVAELEKLIKHEVGDKKLPALSIALVDDQKVVWAAGYGFQDREKKIPATAETVYRVGSVSKLFTDVAVMQLVEEGKLDLDAPVAKYIPDFKPSYKEGEKQITLRMLMSHRSGLIREPPVGNYFDPTEPGVEKTVTSLNGIGLIYPPESRIKYSNAAIGVVGYTLQKSQNEQFEKYVQRRVLEPLSMSASSFLPTPEVKKRLADAVMWTYQGREFPAPLFELGEAPAGCMYSTVLDLAKFQSCLFTGGKIGDKAFLKPETLAEMFRPQFSEKGTKSGFGLGFSLGEFEGKPRVGHGGAIYGFATTFVALPGEKIGAVVVASRDVSNAVTGRIADDALRQMLAAKSGKPLPKIEMSEPLTTNEAVALAGRYRTGERWADVFESGGRVFFEPDRGGARVQLRKFGNGLISDDTQVWGNKYGLTDGKITNGKLTFEKEKPALAPPAEPPSKYKGLIGEYGWDHLPLYIYERNGKLHALIELTEIDPLTEESENVFAFPADRGMYHGEKLVFTRDATGRATKVTSASVVMARRKIDGENGETFKIKSVRPLADLRKEALAAKPPAEKGEFLKPELIDLATIDGVKFDIRYATDNNFLSTPFYSSAKAYMQKPAADALARVHTKLKEQGYGLLVFDAYRPWYVTKMFWDAAPEKFHGFVADPSKGSRHNRGCAVDLTLYDLKTGKVVEMVSGYDEFSDRAFPDYMGGTSRQRWHRELLRSAMHAEGFTVYEEEWWHFDYKDWKKYPILNKTFEELK